MIRLPSGQRGAPEAPWEIREEVETYAREWDRTGRVEFAVGPNLWLAKFSLKPNDPRMKAWQEGRAEEPPVETVVFQERTATGLKALDINEMGPSGVRAFLEKGNTWSGRGETLDSAFKKVADADEAERAKTRNDAREDTRKLVRENKRHLENRMPANWRHHL
jgi:hypothetical protein